MSSPLIPGGQDARKAFTLIELLTVIAIIGILSAITFGVMKGVKERASIGKARSHLVAISAALEAYKRQYGDYPQTGAFTDATPPTAASDSNIPGQLFNALGGKLGPKLQQIDGKAVVEFSRFDLMKTDTPATTGVAQVSNAFVDPWGNAYIYSYRDNRAGKDPTWKNPTYLLLSAGPDGKVSLPGDGLVDNTVSDNADNLYPN